MILREKKRIPGGVRFFISAFFTKNTVFSHEIHKFL